MNVFIINNAQIEAIDTPNFSLRQLIVELKSDGPFDKEYFREIFSKNVQVKIVPLISLAAVSTSLIELKAELLFEFQTQAKWEEKRFKWFKGINLPPFEKVICIDIAGNALYTGVDFEAAAKQHLYPIKVYRLIRTHEQPAINPPLRLPFRGRGQKKLALVVNTYDICPQFFRRTSANLPYM